MTATINPMTHEEPKVIKEWPAADNEAVAGVRWAILTFVMGKLFVTWSLGFENRDFFSGRRDSMP